MFKVNDYVVYNSVGVYKIIDITKGKDINHNETEYYVLQPVYDDSLTVKIPVNNPKISMRSVMTKEEVLALIKAMPEKETVWIDNDRERREAFKTALKSGESEEWVKLVKTLYLEKVEKNEAGKKLMKSDEDIMKAAEKHLHEEFAVALNISPDEVFDYILNHIS